MDRVKTKTTPIVFLPKFKTPAHPCPTRFSNLNYIKPISQLKSSNYRISIRGSFIWNDFLTEKEKEIENQSSFNTSVKLKLLSLENEVKFF